MTRKSDMTVLRKTHLQLRPNLKLGRRRWLNAGFSSALILSQGLNAGCSRAFERTFENLQEVKLHDGKVITLRFKIVILATGEELYKIQRILKVEMWYDALGIYFLDEPKDITGAHHLLSFDIVNGVPMLVRDAHVQDMAKYEGAKDCYFIYFKWVANKWLEVPEAEFPLDIVRYNINWPAYWRSDSETVRKYGLKDFPGVPSEDRISMREYSRRYYACPGRLPPKQKQGGTK
jgi:hypothetical protein